MMLPRRFMQLGDLADIPYVGLVTSQAEIKNNRESVRRTVAAVFDSLAWLRANIHEHGSRYETQTLLTRVTGRPLELQPFLDHLHRRYLAG